MSNLLDFVVADAASADRAAQLRGIPASLFTANVRTWGPTLLWPLAGGTWAIIAPGDGRTVLAEVTLADFAEAARTYPWDPRQSGGLQSAMQEAVQKAARAAFLSWFRPTSRREWEIQQELGLIPLPNPGPHRSAAHAPGMW